MHLNHQELFFSL